MAVLPVLGDIATATDAYDIRIVEWEFDPDLLTNRQRKLYDYWSSERDSGNALSLGRFDPLAIRETVGYLHLVQYDPEKDDFFYRVYGEHAARSAKASMHKHWVSEHPGQAGTKFREHYRSLRETRGTWLGEVYTGDSIDVAAYWRRMVLPLAVPANPDAYVCVTLAEPTVQPPTE